MKRILGVVAVVVLIALNGGCATNPATGKSQLVLMSETQEVQLGLQNAKQIDNSMGLYADPGLQQYVDNIGQSLAKSSERPNLPWRFVVVDDEVVNAFALPGGYIYVSRGILAHFNSEAELAAVIGHEIGHVTGRHSVEQMSRAQLAQVGLGLGSALYSPLQDYSGALGSGLSLLFLKYGRDDERESDALGVRYMTRQDYDPQAAVDVFEMLGRQAATTGGGPPSWLSTHPTPQDRSARLRELIASSAASGGKLEQERYLRRIEGLVYGKDPRNGFFQENRFYHPELRLQMTFPSGWKTQNLAQAVVAKHPKNAAVMQMTMVGKQGHADAAAKFFQQQGLSSAEIKQTPINGLPATSGLFQIATQQGATEGMATFLDYQGNTYQIMGQTAQGQLNTFAQLFATHSGTFNTLSDPALLNVQPLTISLLSLVGSNKPQTIADLYAEHGAPVEANELALLNGVDLNTPLKVGRLIKWVRK